MTAILTGAVHVADLMAGHKVIKFKEEIDKIYLQTHVYKSNKIFPVEQPEVSTPLTENNFF